MQDDDAKSGSAAESNDLLTKAARTVGTALGSVAATAEKVVESAKTAAKPAGGKEAKEAKSGRMKTSKSDSEKSASSALSEKRAANKRKKRSAHRRTLRRSNTSG